jgi:hypothetical protein
MPIKMNQFDAAKSGKNSPATKQKEDKPITAKRSFGKTENKPAQKPAE